MSNEEGIINCARVIELQRETMLIIACLLKIITRKSDISMYTETQFQF